MAWDSSRPVPWKRLVREWALYAGIMAVIFIVFFRDNGVAGALIGLVISLPLYLLLGYALAKIGYQRKNFRELRAERTAGASAPATPAAVQPKERPAPTRRTSTGPSGRPSSSSKRRR
jgi:hypothetical protein